MHKENLASLKKEKKREFGFIKTWEQVGPFSLLLILIIINYNLKTPISELFEKP